MRSPVRCTIIRSRGAAHALLCLAFHPCVPRFRIPCNLVGWHAQRLASTQPPFGRRCRNRSCLFGLMLTAGDDVPQPISAVCLSLPPRLLRGSRIVEPPASAGRAALRGYGSWAVLRAALWAATRPQRCSRSAHEVLDVRLGAAPGAADPGRRSGEGRELAGSVELARTSAALLARGCPTRRAGGRATRAAQQRRRAAMGTGVRKALWRDGPPLARDVSVVRS
eukprot:360331-Chlamydomonas_euryale.AAC.3